MMIRAASAVLPDSGGQGPEGPRHLPEPPSWARDLLTILLLMAFAFAPVPDEQYSMPTVPVLVLAALSWILIPFRRRSPIVFLGAAFALFIAAACLGSVNFGLAAAVAVMVFNVTNRLNQPLSLWLGFGSIALMVTICIIAQPGSEWSLQSVPYGFGIAASAATGNATKYRREYLEALRERAISAERTKDAAVQQRLSEERLRIARDLHDTVAHQIAVINLNAGAGAAALDERPERTREALATIRSASRTVLGEIGDLLAVLRESDADDVPPAPGVADIAKLVDGFRSGGMDIELSTTGDMQRVRGTAGTVVYRVVQEGLTNAHKYGRGDQATVTIDVDTSVRLTITNPIAPVPSDGTQLGLLGLRERVSAVRGTVASGAHGQTWILDVSIPLPEEAA